jgi:hypothetical protein
VEARETFAVAPPIADAAPSDDGSEQAGVATTPELEGERLRAQSSVATSAERTAHGRAHVDWAELSDGRCRDRTSDLLLVRQALSQLS